MSNTEVCMPSNNQHRDSNHGQWTGMSSSLRNQDDNAIDLEYDQSTCEEIQCTSDWKGHHDQPESFLSPMPRSNEQYCDEQQNTAKSNKQNHVILIKYEPNRFMKIQASKNKKRQQLEKLLMPKTCKENKDDAGSSSQSQNNKVSTCLRKYLDGIETGKRRLQIKSPSSLLECGYVSYYTDDYQSKEQTIKHTGEKFYKCDKCSKSCKTKAHLKRHYKKHQVKHTREKPYKCNECDFAATYPSTLKRHEIIHKKEKPYKCDLCNYRTKRCDLLKTHMLIHTGEKPYKCDLCSFSTSISTNLRRHRMTHTGERPYKCDVCPYRSIKFEGLRQHKLTHTGERPYKCDLCDYTSTRNSSVKRHKMKVHMGSNG